jgi:hypothetical protein
MLVVASPAAAGGKPDKEPLGEIHFEFEAGLSCPFAVRWDTISHNTRVLTFPVRPNGDQTRREVGHGRLRVTNAETGSSIVLNIAGRIDTVTHANGLIDITAGGASIVAFFPTDVGGARMVFHRGSWHITGDCDFNFFTASFKGTTTDVCAELASPTV